jgi:hypothetical protein
VDGFSSPVGWSFSQELALVVCCPLPNLLSLSHSRSFFCPGSSNQISVASGNCGTLNLFIVRVKRIADMGCAAYAEPITVRAASGLILFYANPGLVAPLLGHPIKTPRLSRRFLYAATRGNHPLKNQTPPHTPY